MRLGRFTLSLVLAATAFYAQPPNDRETIARGEKLYGSRCAVCHGKDLGGGEGPSLLRSRIVNGASDQRFFDVIRKGIPGTEMAPMPLSDEQTRQIVVFVQSRAKPGHGPPVPGDAAAGRSVFLNAGCLSCHIVEGKGGVIGPDLSSVAIRLSSAQIREALTHTRPAPEGFRQVLVRTRDGRTVEGIVKNQDNFSIQMMNLHGDLLSLKRGEIVSLEFKTDLPLPNAVGKLSPDDLQNLLAFLDRQRAPFQHHDIGFQTY